MSGSKVFLFLQSHPSTFGRNLVKELRRQNYSCRIINFSFSDWVYGWGLGADNFRGKLKHWPIFLKQYLKKHKITDIVYYADQRPYHRIARAVAKELQINAYAYEFGYLRPDWITLEKNGMGVFSHFPNDPSVIMKLSRDLPAPDLVNRFQHSFTVEAINEVFYNIAPVFIAFLYPFFDRDRYYHPLIDYPSYIPRLLRSKKNHSLACHKTERLIENNAPYFLVPMQLQADYQIRRASPYKHLGEMIEEVILSFSENSPVESTLLFKIHPMENSLENWPSVIKQIASKFNSSDRIEIVDGGDLARIASNSKGVVLVNSTVGIQALNSGTPVKVLGVAVYDVPGMTFQGPLKDFWTSNSKPDPELVNAFIRLLAATIQVKGSFFNKSGQSLAINEFVERLTNRAVNNHGAYVDPPPRLSFARELNIPMIYETLD